MGAVVFDNHVFDAWLTKKSEEILSKVDRETISTEEMLTLILKAQTNHFHHVDVEFRAEFKAIGGEIHDLRDEMHSSNASLKKEMHEMNNSLKSEMHENNVNLRVEMHEIEMRLQKEMKDITSNLRAEIHESNTGLRTEMNSLKKELQAIQWRFAGILIPLFGGLYLKLFLG